MNIEDLFFNTNDFEVGPKKIGKGGFSTVYVYKNIKDQKQYATKIIELNDKFNGHNQMHLMRESLIHQKLNHPGVVKFRGINFQSFSDPSKFEPSIITEYLPNGSLKSILKEERQSLAPPEWSSTKKIITIIGISNAMKYLHKHRIIHRDLKSENVLLDDHYYPLICDFGLSRFLPNFDNLTITGQIGTPLHMAPEILEGSKTYIESVDVYAFSLIAYEIITGKIPFEEEFLHGCEPVLPFSFGLEIIKGLRPKFPEFVPMKIQNLISRCWDKNPTKRPSFEHIYNELKKDFTYFGGNVDEDEIMDYIEMIEEEREEEKSDNFFYATKETDDLKKEYIITQLKNENQKLSNSNKYLINKYNELKSINHHNYVLIGEMKKLLIDLGNLNQSEKKLGGIDLVKTAFAKKDKIINDLKSVIDFDDTEMKNKMEKLEKLPQVIESLIEEVKNKDNKINELKDVNQSISKEKADISRQLQKANSSVTSLTAQMKRMKKQFNDEKDEKEQIENELEKYQKEIIDLKCIIDFDDLSSLKQNLENLQNRILESELKEIENKQQLSSNENELNKLRQQCEQHKEQIQQNKKQLKKLGENQKNNDQQASELKDHIKELEEDNNEKQTLIQELHEFVDFQDFKQFPQALNDLLSSKNNKLNELKHINLQLQESKEEVEENNEAMKNKMEKLETELNKIKKENRDNKFMIKNLNEEIKNKDESARKLRKDKNNNAEIMKDIINKCGVSSIDEVPKIFTEMKMKINKGKEKRKKLKEEKTELENQIKQGNEQFQDILKKADEIKIDLNLIKIPLDEVTLEKIKNQIIEMNQNYKGNKTRSTFILKQAKNVGYAGNSVEEALNEIHKSLSSSHKKMEETNKLINEQKEALDEMNSEFNSFKDACFKKEKNLKEFNDKLQDQINILNSIKDNLILLKAGDECDEDFLKEKLNEYELEQIGLIIS